MGVPKLFKIIIDQFPGSHAKVGEQPIDYLFIDFNSIIYEAYGSVEKEYKLLNLRKTPSRVVVEDKILKKMTEITRAMIAEHVKPRVLVYISFDGPPPRAKMMEQKSRRYKKIYGDKIQERLQQEYGESHEDIWDRTYITPGTDFMKRASQKISYSIQSGVFPKNLEYVLSDTSVPGEGEHKFLRYLDALASTRVCIYSNDGDLLMLVNRFPQHETYILTTPRETFNVVKTKYHDARYMYVVVNGMREGMMSRFGKLKKGNYEPIRIQKDYTFFTMIGGNDFMKHIYFLKMKERHTLRVMFGIYQYLLPKHGYLLGEDGLTINQPFMLDYIRMLGKQERKWSATIQERIQNHKARPNRKDTDQMEKEAGMKEWEKAWEKFQHTPYYKKDHPLFQKYRDEFHKIDFTVLDPNTWKQEYYEVFFGIDYANDKKAVNKVCFDYLKTWIFTLRYYFDYLPSWQWYYPYVAAPMPSDLAKTLHHIKDINKVFKFRKDSSFTPLEQLMLVLPPQNKLLPAEYLAIMKRHPEMYPESFEMDVLWGQKYIYAEPDLPPMDVPKILSEMKKVKLGPKWQELNTLNTDPLYFGVKPN